MLSAHKKKLFYRYWEFYLMLLPALVYFTIFWLLPLYGIQIAFRNYHVAEGFSGSEWVGFSFFARYFKSYYFWSTLKNTLGINVYGLLVSFPLTLILALLINEIKSNRFRAATELISYAPSFLSVVVVSGMFLAFLSPSHGFINNLRLYMGMEKIDFLAEPKYFWHIIVWTGIWQGIGFGTIIYTAAFSAIPLELYESAKLDGANKIQNIWYITLPSIKTVMVVMLILSIGGMFSLGFEKILLFQNELNADASEVISTYVYKIGLINGQYSYTTAIGLFNTLLNVIMLWSANQLSKKFAGTSLW